MTDKREDILSRLQAIAAAIPSPPKVLRNVIDPPDTDLPAIIIYDGDELAEERDPEQSRPPNAPRRIKLTPEIVIMLGAAATDVGTSLNVIRAALYKAIASDSTLNEIVLDRIGIHYLGANTELARGRTLEGKMTMHFVFTYGLRVSDL